MEISTENNGRFFNFSFPRGNGKSAFDKKVDRIFAGQPEIGGLTMDEIVSNELSKILFLGVGGEPRPSRRYYHDDIHKAFFPEMSFINIVDSKENRDKWSEIINKDL